MGSDDGDEDERPPHVVDLAAFQIGVQPVINAEYARFVRESGHRPPNVHALPLVVTAGNSEREDVFRRTSETYAWHGGAPPRERLDHPVTMVQWDDAVAYCAWLSVATGRAFRLPSEAEWEKTCRGGLRGQRYPWGERFDQAMVRFLEEPANRAKHGTMPCRAYPANGYGVFDIVGNVWEWVQDWYAEDYYKRRPNPDTDPQGPEEGEQRVLRGGGSWDQGLARCAYRGRLSPSCRLGDGGFRIVVRP